MTDHRACLRRGRAAAVGAALLLALACVSCKDAYSQYKAEWAAFEKEYCSEDIHQAERALKRYRDKLHEIKARPRADLDFDHLLAVAYARSSYLYAQLGRTNEAEQYFVSATNHMNMQAKAGKVAYVPVTRERISEIVEHADSYMDVKWKKRRQPGE